MSVSIFYAILVTSLATFLSRFLGVLSSVKIKETSKIFNWFNCLAYSTLAALIARTVIFPVGVLSDASYLSRLAVVVLSLIIFFVCICICIFHIFCTVFVTWNGCDQRTALSLLIFYVHIINVAHENIRRPPMSSG